MKLICKLYSRISNAILRQCYRRLYYRLFWHYAKAYITAEETGYLAAEAFFGLLGMSGRNGYLISIRRARGGG